MTKIVVKKNGENITNLSVNEHAGYDEYGYDIVCAGISAIVFGGLNALVEAGLDPKQVVIKDAYVNVDLNKQDKIQVIAQTVLTQLRTIQESHPDYINIEII